MDIVIKDQILGNGEFYSTETKKDTLYFHHTAGSHRPDWVINGWDTDDNVNSATGKKTPRAVGTSFVIGGISTTDKNADFDGVIYRAFNEKYWTHHLGTKYANNTTLNKQSIGIEVCNYGPLTLGKDGVFYNYVNKPVPKEMVVKLDKIFKGFLYYHAYTDKQIQTLKDLSIFLKSKFPEITFNTPLTSVEGFELSNDAKSGKPGIYSHTNVRSDKFDMSPQPKLIEMIKTLKNNTNEGTMLFPSHCV